MKPHETNHVVAAHAIFEKFVTKSGCMQRRRQHLRKKDGLFVQLVLLPMNTKKKDIQALINKNLVEARKKRSAF